MNTLHDRFPDFDFGEDAREDQIDSLQLIYQIYLGITYNFKMVICYYIQKQPLRGACGWVCFQQGCRLLACSITGSKLFRGWFSIILTANFTLQHFLHHFSRALFFSIAPLVTVLVYLCPSKVSLIQLKIIITYFFIRFAQPKITLLISFTSGNYSYITVNIVITACVTVFYINGRTSLLPIISQIKTAESQSERCRTSEVELFAKVVNSLKPLTIITKSSILDVLNVTLN